MLMTLQLLLGSAIISVTILIHVGFTVAAEWGLTREHIWPGQRAGPFRFVVLLVGMTLWLLGSMTVAVWLWAFCLRGLDVLHDMETAVYFSLVSFTTLGFGDIILDKQWRILSGLMAANGLLIFGLTTAVLVDFLSRFRRA
jgi:hypothetical protein